MRNSFTEEYYPLSFRREEAQKLGEHLRLRHSVELVGLKHIGISNFLRFFLFHKDIVKTYINHGEKHLFIPVDLNDLVEREIFPFWILTFKRLVDKAETLDIDNKIVKAISGRFLSSIQSRDVFMTIENLRAALELLVSANILPTIFFIHFDRLESAISQDFFANLEGLKAALGDKLAYVFTSFRDLHGISPTVFERKRLSVFSHVMHFAPANDDDMKVVFRAFEKRYNTSLNDETLKELVSLCGGHVQYLQVALIILNEKAKNKSIKASALSKLISEDERFKLESDEIWESLTDEEQKVLSEIVDGKKPERGDASYLWETGLVDGDSGFNIFSPLFGAYLGKKSADDGGKRLEFSKKENVLFNMFLDSLGEICEREKIINAVWPEYEEIGVSDWTIDRLVARLREKLKKAEEQIHNRNYKNPRL